MSFDYDLMTDGYLNDGNALKSDGLLKLLSNKTLTIFIHHLFFVGVVSSSGGVENNMTNMVKIIYIINQPHQTRNCF